MVNLPGGRRPFEAGRGGLAAWGRVLHHPLATTQLVEGACLIRRYRAVRSRGGQLWRDSSGGQSALLITGRPRVRILSRYRWPVVQSGESAEPISRESAADSTPARPTRRRMPVMSKLSAAGEN